MPKGVNDWSQLLASRKHAKAGDLADLKRRLWFAVETIMAGMREAMQADDHDETRKWLHCLSQLSGTYSRLLLGDDVELRLRAIESAQGQGERRTGVVHEPMPNYEADLAKMKAEHLQNGKHDGECI